MQLGGFLLLKSCKPKRVEFCQVLYCKISSLTIVLNSQLNMSILLHKCMFLSLCIFWTAISAGFRALLYSSFTGVLLLYCVVCEQINVCIYGYNVRIWFLFLGPLAQTYTATLMLKGLIFLNYLDFTRYSDSPVIS